LDGVPRTMPGKQVTMATTLAPHGIDTSASVRGTGWKR
jgi:hypothetical protein